MEISKQHKAVLQFTIILLYRCAKVVQKTCLVTIALTLKIAEEQRKCFLGIQKLSFDLPVSQISKWYFDICLHCFVFDFKKGHGSVLTLQLAIFVNCQD